MATAALKVRKVIQRIRVADKSNFEALCQELEQAQIDQLEDMGSMADTVLEEASKAMEQAKARIEKSRAEEGAEAEKRREQEARREKEEGRAAVLAREVEEVVAAAELLVAEATEAAKPFTQEDTSPQDLVDAAAAVMLAAEQAKTSLGVAAKTLPEKRKEMGKAEKSIDFNNFNERLRAGRTALAKLVASTKEKRDRANRLARHARTELREKEEFKRHDLDNDGELSRVEVVSFAKTQFDFSPDDAFLEKLFRRVACGAGGGVTLEKFHQMRVFVAVEKSVVKAREQKNEELEQAKRRAEEAERAAVLAAEARVEVEQAVEDVRIVIADNEAAVSKVVQGFDDLSAAVAPGGGGRTREQAEEELKEVRSQADAAKVSLEAAESLLSDAGRAGITDNAAVASIKASLISAEANRIRLLQDRLAKAVEKGVEMNGRLARRRFTDLEPVRNQVCDCLCATIASTDLTREALFDKAVGASGGDVLGSQAFGIFMKSLADFVPAAALPESVTDALDDDKIEQLFRHVADSEGSISRERFFEMLTKAYYRVSKSTILTASENLVNSKSIRRLEEREVVRALDAPSVDPDSKVTRMRCSALLDGTEGWATAYGNKGTVFLEPCARFMVCAVESAPMTEALAEDGVCVRNIERGEVVTILEMDVRDPGSGVSRLRCQSVTDNSVGWVTLATKSGPVLEPC
eukprot:TRINITY_DN4952_c0_g1_i1.p1 TRINITY_DN4952_c0_g1~~TRINITY_DN4952_c0_g1_i1.p1  ORF type:complete len:804 (-),score=218.70 TRINITY_DN4952_c0_g1_i1:143-2221(-)